MESKEVHHPAFSAGEANKDVKDLQIARQFLDIAIEAADCAVRRATALHSKKELSDRDLNDLRGDILMMVYERVCKASHIDPNTRRLAFDCLEQTDQG